MAPTAIGAAVVILVAGIVLAIRPDLAIIAASPSVSPSDDVALASPSPTPGGSPRPTRSVPPAPPCVRDDDNTNADLTIRGGFTLWYSAILFDEGSTRPDPPGDWTELIAQVRGNDPSVAWRVAAGNPITVVSSAARCIASWRAAFVRLDDPGSFMVKSSGGTVSPAGRSLAVVPPGPGDWLVWLAVEMPVPESSRWVGTVGRLLVGASGVPAVPIVLPAAACDSPPGPADAALFLDEVAVAGVDPAAIGGQVDAEPTVVPVGARVEIRMVGDRCASSWDVRGVPRDAGTEGKLPIRIVYKPVVPDLAIGAQNRFPIAPDSGPVGTWDITGTFGLPDGTSITRVWTITYERLLVPPLLVGREGGTVRARAWVGCGLSVQYPNGNYSGGDSCGSNLPGEVLETVVVSVGSRLTFEVTGWTILDWGAEAGRIVGAAGDPANFESIEGGFLRGATSPPVDFPAPGAGAGALRIWATLVRDGVTLNGSWYVLVDVR